MKSAYLMTAIEKRHCPLCDYDKYILLSRRMQHHLDLDTVICKKCGFVYTNPLPSREVYDRFYTEAYSDYYGHVASDLGGLRREDPPPYLQRRLSQIEAIRSLAGTRLLEVGPGKGLFLWWAQCRGSEVCGIEPSSDFYHQLVKEGLPCIHGTIENFVLDNNPRYDAIAMFHVFEHFYDPNAVLYKCRDLLMQNGLLIIDIPNIYKPFRSLDRYFLRYVHPSNFSPETLYFLLQKHGFDAIYIDDNTSDCFYPQNLFVIAIKQDNRSYTANEPETTATKVFWHLQLYRLRWYLWKGLLWHVRNHLNALIRLISRIKRKLI